MDSKSVTETKTQNNLLKTRKRRRSNLCLNKPKQRAKLAKLHLLPGDTAATGERPTKSSDISSTPMDQRLPVFQDDMLNAPHRKKNMKSSFAKDCFKKKHLRDHD
ncbi:uncharacterized protein LOC132739385 [Ruditapes philippinarum]|uniref:uncharacterized protein LOC132739385 n=1 Tax=Ruditapes philippinarum TaxID=129788 RepID=UPI00295C1FC1|nr:uncharacterized protein LOC132739385 [Ruditapes philippinarum]